MRKYQTIILYACIILSTFISGCIINGFGFGIGVLIGWAIGGPIGWSIGCLYLFIKKKWRKAKESEEES